MLKGRRSRESLWIALAVDMEDKPMKLGSRSAGIEMPENNTQAYDDMLDSRTD